MARSALMFDWLWFEPATSIMLAEPGLLLMARSMPKFVDMTASLLHALVDTSARCVRSCRCTLIAHRDARTLAMLCWLAQCFAPRS